MVATIPIGEPAEVTQGDTIRWRYKNSDYDPATWTLTYALVNANHQTQSVTCTDNGDGTHLFTLSATDSRALGSGKWHFQGKMSSDGIVELVTEGAITVKRDFSLTGQNYDARSHAEIVLDAIEAVIQNRASSDQSSMSLNGRSLSLMSHKELEEQRALYRSEVANERAAERIAQGLGSGQRVLVRM